MSNEDTAVRTADKSAAPPSDFNPVAWFEIYVTDMERAKAFYGAMLGVEFSRIDNPVPDSDIELWAFPMQQEGYGAGGALVRMQGYEAGHNSVIVYFHCADCAVEAARAAEAGGEVVKPKHPIGEHGYIALIKDVEGTIIGLHSMK